MTAQPRASTRSPSTPAASEAAPTAAIVAPSTITQPSAITRRAASCVTTMPPATTVRAHQRAGRCSVRSIAVGDPPSIRSRGPARRGRRRPTRDPRGSRAASSASACSPPCRHSARSAGRKSVDGSVRAIVSRTRSGYSAHDHRRLPVAGVHVQELAGHPLVRRHDQMRLGRIEAEPLLSSPSLRITYASRPGLRAAADDAGVDRPVVERVAVPRQAEGLLEAVLHRGCGTCRA